ncbi:hypothetical protein AKJ43_01930 [candidate division MSBL1 archaeon SCGC-AAA261D19]|uniref:Uncharacterized protein n=1 Tax=candidate division MSBL1 archaeon SCGC-AAA261D19 TaxID=1698273 RepID=A0A133V7F7_9EURY|nr:hypothetical protein AKJ43_01930 [candidate division MSBL1 archaeon SCGC-AAA261D19]
MFKGESEVVDKLRGATDFDSVSSLQEIYKRINLASRNFEELWSKWWKRNSLDPLFEIKFRNDGGKHS